MFHTDARLSPEPPLPSSSSCSMDRQRDRRTIAVFKRVVRFGSWRKHIMSFMQRRLQRPEQPAVDPTRPGFLTLPPEIRTPIYELVFVCSAPVHPRLSRSHTCGRRLAGSKLEQGAFGLFVSCRTVHAEVCAMAYGANAFAFSTHLRTRRPLINECPACHKVEHSELWRLPKWLKSIGPVNAQHLRRLEIALTDYDGSFLFHADEVRFYRYYSTRPGPDWIVRRGPNEAPKMTQLLNEAAVTAATSAVATASLVGGQAQRRRVMGAHPLTKALQALAAQGHQLTHLKIACGRHRRAQDISFLLRLFCEPRYSRLARGLERVIALGRRDRGVGVPRLEFECDGVYKVLGDVADHLFAALHWADPIYVREAERDFGTCVARYLRLQRADGDAKGRLLLGEAGDYVEQATEEMARARGFPFTCGCRPEHPHLGYYFSLQPQTMDHIDDWQAFMEWEEMALRYPERFEDPQIVSHSDEEDSEDRV